MACEADLSVVEQQQEPLAAKEEAAPGPRQGLTLRKGVLVAAGVLLLGAAALALYARPPTAFGTAGAATRETADLIQAYALKKNGRTLTQEELTKVQHHIDNAKFHGMAGTAMAGGAFKPRSLQEADVSEKCQKSLEEMGKVIFAKVIGYVMEAFTACGEDKECSECKKAQAKLEGLEDELKAQCKSSGRYCTLTEGEDDEKEEETVCMPKECHDEPDLAAKIMEDEAHHEEGHEHCDDCTATVTCGDDED